MKILVVTDVSAQRVLGGAERMLTEHLRALKHAGHDVTVLTRQPDESAPLELTVCETLTEYRLTYHGDRGRQGLKQLEAEARIWWQKHGRDFDAIVSEQPFTMWALIRAGCQLPRLQVCYSFAFEEFLTRHAGRWNLKDKLVAMAMKHLESRIYHGADRLLVLSRYTEQRLHEVFGLSRSKVIVTPGGVDLPPPPAISRESMRASLQWRGPVVITLRNLVPRTGVDLLVAAAGLLKDEYPDLRWCVIGQGPLLEKLKEQAKSLGVSERIEFTGYLSEQDVKLRMHAADLFMLPTRDLEGFGLVTIEANACGLPVVATPVTANKEVVPSLPFNRLATAVSAEALADAVRAMLGQKGMDESERNELRSAVDAKYAWRHHDATFVAAVECLK
jgi:glycosyltransferase involved in cell wall biosynthesis